MKISCYPRFPAILLLIAVLLTGCGQASLVSDAEAGRDREVILATTTSLHDSGLLDVLLPVFEDETGYRVKPISVGTGAALAMGARGEADVVFVHAPEAEKAWMAEGNGTERILVMYNDFVIAGPPGDPAGLRGRASATDALEVLFQAGATWISRDDNSGTDQLEKRLWRETGVDPTGQAWLVTSGQGMGGTLTLADQKDAYTLTDRGTYLAMRDMLELEIMVEGDQALLNVYHVMPVNPEQFPDVPINLDGARAFAAFLVEPDIQEIIGEYGTETFGQPLFHPAAGMTEEQLGQ